jgi:hypothetical protein
MAAHDVIRVPLLLGPLHGERGLEQAVMAKHRQDQELRPAEPLQAYPMRSASAAPTEPS